MLSRIPPLAPRGDGAAVVGIEELSNGLLELYSGRGRDSSSPVRTQAEPRTDPSAQCYRTGLLPWVGRRSAAPAKDVRCVPTEATSWRAGPCGPIQAGDADSDAEDRGREHLKIPKKSPFKSCDARVVQMSQCYQPTARSAGAPGCYSSRRDGRSCLGRTDVL